MHRNDSNASCALWGRGFAALWAVVVLAPAFSARPAEAEPFAFVQLFDTDEFSMIDLATDEVVATVPLSGPFQQAVTRDGTYAYAANSNSNEVLVIAAATGKVVKKVRVGKAPYGVIIGLDGRHVFVLNRISNTISVIDTSTNKVAETVPAGAENFGVTIAPDGKHIYGVE
jgi:YVTN family beta-propeller protein